MNQTRTTRPMVAIAAVFVLAGGYLHLREWLDTYRHVPAGADGSFVVRLGFPVHVAVSVVLAAVLLAALRSQRLLPLAVAAAAAFEAASLATLIVSRTGSVLGWAEPAWTVGAEQTRAVEIGALLVLGALAALHATVRRAQVA
jgi:hypothetical protein